MYKEYSDDQSKQQIQLLIDLWDYANPEESKAFDLMMAEIIKTRMNSTATTRNKEMRYALEIPHSLYEVIKKRFPLTFSDKKELRWFMKTFPRFKVPTKI
jgi:hypothetical protein